MECAHKKPISFQAAARFHMALFTEMKGDQPQSNQKLHSHQALERFPLELPTAQRSLYSLLELRNIRTK